MQGTAVSGSCYLAVQHELMGMVCKLQAGPCQQFHPVLAAEWHVGSNW